MYSMTDFERRFTLRTRLASCQNCRPLSFLFLPPPHSPLSSAQKIPVTFRVGAVQMGPAINPDETEEDVSPNTSSPAAHSPCPFSHYLDPPSLPFFSRPTYLLLPFCSSNPGQRSRSLYGCSLNWRPTASSSPRFPTFTGRAYGSSSLRPGRTSTWATTARTTTRREAGSTRCEPRRELWRSACCISALVLRPSVHMPRDGDAAL